jgi:tetratricopeptide (TPR) repeat protein
LTQPQCPACHAALAPNAKFCPSCGKPLDSAQKSAGGQPSEANRERPLRLRDVFLVLGVIAAFSVGFFALKSPGQRPQPAAADMRSIPGHDADMSALQNMPTDFEGLVAAGDRQMDNGNYLIATEAYRRALALKPAAVDVRTDYGACLYAMGLPERALREFYAVIGTMPQHAIVHFNMGIVYHSIGQADSASSYFRRYLEIEPDGPSAPTARQLLAALKS